MEINKLKKWLTTAVIFVIVIRYLSCSYHDLIENHTSTYTDLIELTNKMNRTLSIQAIIIIAIINLVYMIALYSNKKLDTKIGDNVLIVYFFVIGSAISFIIYNLNFCFKPWLIPFKTTIAKILTMPKKNKIGKILGNVMHGEYSEEDHEMQLLKNNPFPLFFSAQSNHLIDFLKYLNPKYEITPSTPLSNDNPKYTEFKELYKTLVTIEKNAALVWVILFATFFSQTTITYMNYVV
jgi:hypothetical protein